MDVVIALLQYYSFDLDDYSIDDLVKHWCEYDPLWVRLAIIEALFRGRYKAVSVDQILEFWQRKGEPYCRFSCEFERLVCGDLAFPLLSMPRKVTYTPYKPVVPNVHGTKSKPKSEPNAIVRQTENSYTSKSPPQKSVSSTYQSAMQQMSLLADSSLFVDKLKSMCQEKIYKPSETSWRQETSLIAQLTAHTDI